MRGGQGVVKCKYEGGGPWVREDIRLKGLKNGAAEKQDNKLKQGPGRERALKLKTPFWAKKKKRFRNTAWYHFLSETINLI